MPALRASFTALPRAAIVYGVFAVAILSLSGCSARENGAADDHTAEAGASPTSTPASATASPTSPHVGASDAPVPLPEDSSEATPTRAGDGDVTPVITSASVIGDHLDVDAAVNGIVDENGQCTLELSTPRGDALSISVTAFPDAASTICEPFSVPVSSLVSGTWRLTVSYSSAFHHGISPTSTVEVR